MDGLAGSLAQWGEEYQGAMNPNLLDIALFFFGPAIHIQLCTALILSQFSSRIKTRSGAKIGATIRFGTRIALDAPRYTRLLPNSPECTPYELCRQQLPSKLLPVNSSMVRYCYQTGHLWGHSCTSWIIWSCLAPG